MNILNVDKIFTDAVNSNIGRAVTIKRVNEEWNGKEFIGNDVTGILVQVLDKPFKNGNKIILRDLPKGNYILKLDENSTQFILE